MSEAQVTAYIYRIARKYGLFVWYCHNPIHSIPGFPDFVIIGRYVMWREVKVGDARLTREQAAFLNALTYAAQDVGVWRDIDVLSGRIEREIAANAPALLGEINREAA